MKQLPKKAELFQMLKIIFGTAAAIILAFWMKLDYATSAGIITLLTIQNTRRDTIRLAIYRMCSFVVTMLISWLSISIVPNDGWAFVMFLGILVPLSAQLNWMGALSVNVVLGTHVIFMEHTMNWAVFSNEGAMVILGIGLALIANLRMHNLEGEIQTALEEIDNSFQQILFSVAKHVNNQTSLEADEERLEDLIKTIEDAVSIAIKHRENTMKSHSQYYVDYFNMRRDQCEVLIGFYYEVKHHQFVIPEAETVSSLIFELAQDLHIQKNLTDLKYRLLDYELNLLHGEMPKDSDELESKIVLYRLAKELGEVLYSQEHFKQCVTEEQKSIYWSAFRGIL